MFACLEKLSLHTLAKVTSRALFTHYQLNWLSRSAREPDVFDDVCKTMKEYCTIRATIHV